MRPLVSGPSATGDTNMKCLLGAAALPAGPALARDQIRVAGSSTVYPFTTAVATAPEAIKGDDMK